MNQQLHHLILEHLVFLLPFLFLGYHYDQNSKFELEVLSNIKSLKSIGASLLANYRFYPDLDIDPVKLYVSGGLGGYLQITPFG